MRNYFTELLATNMNQHVEKKGKFNYISWAHAVASLRSKYPNATWEVKRFGEEQLPYQKTAIGYFVEVPVTVEGITLSQPFPVLDHKNRPCGQKVTEIEWRNNKKVEVIVDVPEPTVFDVNTSIQRALVKTIGLHGLGLYIYAGEDIPDELVDDEGSTENSSADSTNNAVTTTANKPAPAGKNKPPATPPVESNSPAPEAPAGSKQAETIQNPSAAPDETPPWEEPASEVKPINEGQIRSIGSMLTLVSKKKSGFSPDDFLANALKPFGKDKVEELTFDQAREIVMSINEELRKK